MYNKIKYRLILWMMFAYTFIQIKKPGKKGRVFVVGSPFHYNLGDHAQTYCTKLWLERNYPEYSISVFDTYSATMLNFALIRYIKRIIGSDDIFFLHSGYHVTNLYPLEINMQKKIIATFHNNEIIALPQTVNFTDEHELREAARIFNTHPKLTLMSRDEVSFESAKKEFPNAINLLFPDIVTSMIGTKQFDSERSGIHLCLRNDKESAYKKSGDADKLATALEKIDQVVLSDTESSHNPLYIRRHLDRVLNDSWREFSKHRLTITDRYHGTIFSLVAGTPVIVLASTDHKLKSGVKWFPRKIFSKYVRYAKDVDEAIELANSMYSSDALPVPSTYFVDKYWGNNFVRTQR